MTLEGTDIRMVDIRRQCVEAQAVLANAQSDLEAARKAGRSTAAAKAAASEAVTEYSRSCNRLRMSTRREEKLRECEEAGKKWRELRRGKGRDVSKEAIKSWRKEKDYTSEESTDSIADGDSHDETICRTTFVLLRFMSFCSV